MANKMYEILRKDTMQDGTKIQLEDWKEVYPGIEKTIIIAAYPIAKNDSYWIRKGESFRLQISRLFSTDTEVEYIYQGLIDGHLKLEDLEEHYYNIKDKYYMGMEG